MTKIHENICDCCEKPITDDPDVKIKGEVTLKTGERKIVNYCKKCGVMVMLEVTRLGIIKYD